MISGSQTAHFNIQHLALAEQILADNGDASPPLVDSKHAANCRVLQCMPRLVPLLNAVFVPEELEDDERFSCSSIMQG